MKFVKFATTGNEGKIHIIPKHANRTLCGYPMSNDFIEMKWDNMEANCLYCLESLDELIKAKRALEESK